MADKYRRADKPAPEQPSNPNEIRLTAIGRRKNYISYAIGKLTGEQPERSLILKGMGAAVVKVVTVAEIIKRRVAGLHQTTTLSSTHIVDTFEPLEEGLKTVTIEKHVPTIEIVLSFDPLDTNHPGYQPPLPADQVIEQDEELVRRGAGGRGGFRGRGRGGRGRGRGGFRGRGGGRGGAGAAAASGDAADASAGAEDGGSPSRGGGYRGRGGRGGRGRGRGGRGRGGADRGAAPA